VRRVLLGGISSQLLRRSALPLLVVARVGHDGDAERGTGGGPAV
jgi:hypothetical protein